MKVGDRWASLVAISGSVILAVAVGMYSAFPTRSDRPARQEPVPPNFKASQKASPTSRVDDPERSEDSKAGIWLLIIDEAGDPLASTDVSINNGKSTTVVATTLHGTLHLDPHLLNSGQRVALKSLGFFPALLNAADNLHSGQTIRLIKQRMVTLRVEDGFGYGVHDATVKIHDDFVSKLSHENLIEAPVRTNRNGIANLAVPTNEVEISVSAAGYLTNVDVLPPECQHIVVEIAGIAVAMLKIESEEPAPSSTLHGTMNLVGKGHDGLRISRISKGDKKTVTDLLVKKLAPEIEDYRWLFLVENQAMTDRPEYPVLWPVEYTEFQTGKTVAGEVVFRRAADFSFNDVRSLKVPAFGVKYELVVTFVGELASNNWYVLGPGGNHYYSSQAREQYSHGDETSFVFEVFPGSYRILDCHSFIDPAAFDPVDILVDEPDEIVKIETWPNIRTGKVVVDVWSLGARVLDGTVELNRANEHSKIVQVKLSDFPIQGLTMLAGEYDCKVWADGSEADRITIDVHPERSTYVCFKLK